MHLISIKRHTNLCPKYIVCVSHSIITSACPTDYVELGSSCFHFGDTPDYFEGARNYCINGMGTSLAVLDDCETYSALANYLTEQGW